MDYISIEMILMLGLGLFGALMLNCMPRCKLDKEKTMKELNNQQQYCCLKIEKHRENPKACAKYFAGLIGSGASPEDVPDEVKKIWGANRLTTEKGEVCYGGHTPYNCKKIWGLCQEAFPEDDPLVEIRFKASFINRVNN